MFARLTPEYKKITIDAMERVELPAREVIVKQGDPGDFFYIIETGRFSVFVDEGMFVEISQFSAEFSTVYKIEMSDGDCFGDLALLYNAKRAATVVSTTPSIVYRYVSLRSFGLLNREPDWAETSSRMRWSIPKCRILILLSIS